MKHPPIRSLEDANHHSNGTILSGEKNHQVNCTSHQFLSREKRFQMYHVQFTVKQTSFETGSGNSVNSAQTTGLCKSQQITQRHLAT
jgi:hypothetical protein